MSSPSSAARADPTPWHCGSASHGRKDAGQEGPARTLAEERGAVGPRSRWPLALARGRDTERRVAGAARVATQVLDDVLRSLRVAGGSGALQTRRLRFHLLSGALELWPLLPDFRLCLGLVGQ